MSKQETQDQQEIQGQQGKKMISGNWVILLFAVLFALIILVQFLRN